ncbi:MAG: asparagine synthase (glutamine-hydrolyzing) [Bacteroidia bacterium]|nr:asparagine synthase (glutamine-hydrolyzing) [Bacteroidia bacterium]NNC86012.1 asparagine synthase (glutamine-hydrolyzing) [Bacteroidia bacterium]NNM15286.1 asparagine synthase (glutamine-hydrolyzing) [Bacteroidia bacterium]
MCGIAGFMSFKKDISEQEFLSALDKTEHRGPDFSAIFRSEIGFLGHNRLKILDLSDNANQPMHSHNERYVTVYNGEVYNFEELSQSLEKGAQSLTTTCDTEVILELFSETGVNFLTELNGMFSIAIYDKIEHELYLSIDKIGIKPLYYYWDGEQLAFSSELKNLTALQTLNFSINNEAIKLFLHMGFIPAPHTIYNNIKKLEPGSYIKFNDKGLELKQYWNANNKLNDEIISDETEAINKLDELLSSSVKYRLKSDVPYGVFLSGGIDSSVVAAKTVEVSNDKINTFTIGFKESQFNEADIAKKVANALNTNHHEFMVTHKEAIDLVESIIDCYDEPYADSSSIPTMLVSKMASKHVTVVLSGEGGDELFHGYGAYQWAERLANPLLHNFKKPLSLILNQLPNRYKRVSKLLDYNTNTFLPAHIFSQEQYFFTENELGNLLSESFFNNSDTLENSSLKFNNLSNSNNSLNERVISPSEKQAIFELQCTLPGDLLTKIDRATMKYSIEGRVPLLDYRIVEFALNLDPSLKVKNGDRKHILKKVLYRHLSVDLFNRKKQGFALPIKKWLNSELKYLIEENLSKGAVESIGILNYKYVSKLVSQYRSGHEYLFNRIWSIIILQLWMKKNRTD